MDYFARSTLALGRDRFLPLAVTFLGAVTLLFLWTGWLLFATVGVYALSASARLEVDRSASPVDAVVSGRVVAVHVAVGRQVKAGDVLVELDPAEEILQLREGLSRVTALRAQLAAVERELQSEIASRARQREAADALRAEAQARSDETAAAAEFAVEEASRTKALHDGQLVAEVDMLRMAAEARRREAAAEASRRTLARLDAEDKRAASEHDIRLARLQREASELRGQADTMEAAISLLRYGQDRRRIVAPVDGRIAEAADLRAGTVLAHGARVATILPEGEVQAVAYFDPSAALGRVRPGQHARMRIDGFPWSQYGSLAAHVTSVADEVRDNRVRVVLGVSPLAAPHIPRQHGLPGTAEVEIDRVSPAVLALRWAGMRVSGRQ